MKKTLLAISLLLVLFTLGCNKTTLTSNNTTAIMESEKIKDVVDYVLNIDENRDIKILQLTDTQIIDADQRRTENRISDGMKTLWKIDNVDSLLFNYMDDVVSKTNPDLIVLTGDNVYGEFDDLGTSLELLIEHIDSYKIPWTLCYGNHDNETILGATWQNEQYEKSEYCMFKRGSDEAEGNGNFTIGITVNNKLREVIYMLDGHGCVNSSKEERVYSKAGIYDGQLNWIKNTASRINKANDGVSPKSLAFEHYALRALGDALQAYGYTSIKNDFYSSDGSSSKFKVVNIESDNGDYGTINEDPSFIDGDYVFFNLLKNIGCEGVFFGHNHENSCSVEYKGIRLTYGVKTGTYDSHDKNLLGGTLISLKNDGSLSVEPIYSKGLNE